MITSTRFITVVMAVVAMIGFGTGSAAAEAANGEMVPLSSIFRACDFSRTGFVSAMGGGSGQVFIGTGGTSTVTADVTPADRQAQHSLQRQTDTGAPTGVAAVQCRGPRRRDGRVEHRRQRDRRSDRERQCCSGATGAWVFVEGPPDPGEIRGEFYTSDIHHKPEIALDTTNPVEPLGLHRIRVSRVLLAFDRDALGLCALVGTGHPYGQHTGVIGRGDRLSGDMRRQPERPAERAIAYLAERAALCSSVCSSRRSP